MKLYIYSLVLAASLLTMQAHAAETGSALKDDKLRKEPFADAKLAGDLKRGESLEIIGKQGAWLNVKTKKSAGWVRLLAVKRGATSANTNATSDALKVASGRAGTGKVVATTGIRGLSAEELKSATFNETEIKQLETYTTSKEQAQQFATSGGLKANNFAYLTEQRGK